MIRIMENNNIVIMGGSKKVLVFFVGLNAETVFTHPLIHLRFFSQSL